MTGGKNSTDGKKNSMETFRKVLRYLGAYRILLVLSVLLAAASVILQLAIPLLFGEAIDAMIAAGKVDFETIRFYLGRILVMLLACGAASWLHAVSKKSYRCNLHNTSLLIMSVCSLLVAVVAVLLSAVFEVDFGLGALTGFDLDVGVDNEIAC